MGLPLLAVGGVASFLTASWWAPVAAALGFLCVFQARSGVCVAMAARGAQDMDAGPCALHDLALVTHFRRRAWAIVARTLVATLALLVASRAWLQLARA